MSVLGLLLLCQVLLGSATGQMNFRSPCPSVFSWDLKPPPSHQYSAVRGVITIPALVSSTLRVQFEIPLLTLQNYKGRLVFDGDRDKIFRGISDKTLKTVRYILLFQADMPPPELVYIQHNGKIICSSVPRPKRAKTTISVDHSYFVYTARQRAWNYSTSYEPFVVLPEEQRLQPQPHSQRQPQPPPQQPPLPYHDSFGPSKSGMTPVGPPSNPSVENFRESCGRPVQKNDFVALVVSGSSTKRGEWPWIVPLYDIRDSGLMYICGSTLVSRKFLITAAHCVVRRRSSDVIAFVGKFNLSDWTDHSRANLISEIHVHEDFETGAYAGDLAVLKLQESVTYSESILPACLWFENPVRSPSREERGYVVGWGRDGHGNFYTQTPFMIALPVVSLEKCFESHKDFVTIAANKKFCAGERNGKGPCNGDSGSGLVVLREGRDGNMRWFLRGIVSLTRTDPEKPGMCYLNDFVVFTDVARYQDWLTRILYERD